LSKTIQSAVFLATTHSKRICYATAGLDHSIVQSHGNEQNNRPTDAMRNTFAAYDEMTKQLCTTVRKDIGRIPAAAWEFEILDENILPKIFNKG